MGFFTKAWRPFHKLPVIIAEAVCLYKDGSYQVGPLKIEQATSINNTVVNGCRVHKRAGYGKVLTIKIHRVGSRKFRFDGTNWFVYH